ncbi:MAG TPA: LysM domain-containing protein, partial [Chthoniobacteraceae bacterium]
IFLVGAFVSLCLGVCLLHVLAIGGIYALGLFESKRAERQPAPIPSVTAIVSGDPVTYVVQPGDDPRSVARAFGVSTKELIRLNQLDRFKKLEPGTVLNLPASKKAKAEIVRL